MREPEAIRPDLARLERDVRRIAVPRHPVAEPGPLADAEDLVALELAAAGLRVERQAFQWKAREFHNVVGTLEGADPARPIVVVGAHFDSVACSPGADDNASGVAALLELARLLAPRRFGATVHFVGFNLEEVQGWAPPTYRIGSREYVAWLRKRKAEVAGAFVLEMVGFTGPRQDVPAAVRLVKRVPREGTFLAAVGDGGSRLLLAAMERAADGVVPLVTLTVPLKGYLVPDTRRSDNARFWDAGWPALMVTDTADLRNPHYHQPTDTPDRLDYRFLGKVVETVAEAVAWTAR
jgi:Zn-dependent M28 family amino/carboxypeptidase